MLVISLDETGKFEDINSNAPLVIAGAVYQVESEEDIENEKTRICNWLKKCCIKRRYQYPDALHGGRDGEHVPQDLIDELRKTLKAFLAGEAPWDGLSGKYKLYATVGTKTVSPSLFTDGGNLTDDNSNSVRYQHMANSTVNHLLFDVNEFTNEDKVTLNLATRSIGYDEDKLESYKNSGYFPKAANGVSGESYRSFVATSDSYRGMLLASLPTSDRKKTTYNLSVESMKYREEVGNSQAFLWLADVVCLAMGNATYVERAQEIGKASSLIDKTCQDMVGESNYYIWIYHDIDHLWSKILKAYRDKDYFGCLSYMFDAQKFDDAIVSIYNKNWFNPIRNRILNSNNPNDIRNALEGLEQYYNGNYENDRGAYVYEAISMAILSKKDKNEFKALLSKMYSVEMVINNHNGDYEAAKKSFVNVGRYAKYISIEDLCEMRNRYAVALTDSGEYLQSVDVARKTIKLLNEYLEWRGGYTNVKQYPAILGRTYSQRAQSYAYMNSNNMANQDFRMALEIFDKGSFNYQFTMSLYLHSLIEMGDEETYARKAKEYFKTSDVTKQYLNVDSLDNTHSEFALYVYVKALWFFYMDKVSKEDLKEFLVWIKTRYMKDKSKSHPKELIFKYCAFIYCYLGDKKSAEEYIAKANEISDDGDTTIREIIDNGNEEYERLKNGQNPFDDDEMTYMYR